MNDLILWNENLLEENNIIIYKEEERYKIDKIKKKEKKKLIISYEDLIKKNKNKKIILSNIKNKYDKIIKIYKEEDNEYNSQEYLNYLINNIEIKERIDNILKLLNNNEYVEIITYKMKKIKVCDLNMKEIKEEIKFYMIF